MEKQSAKIDYGLKIMDWEVPEYDSHQKSQGWYILAISIGLVLIFYCFYSHNFLFALIIILTSWVIVLREGVKPEKVKIILTGEGVIVGRKFYDYDEIKNFSIVYKPRLEVKKLYFEFKSSLRHRLSISLDNENPLKIREILLRYLTEDLERTDQPLSEFLAKLFKL
jgi:hypothetical protein